MIDHQQIYYSNFSPRQLFLLVKDIEKYPEFLPWCSTSRVEEVSPSELRAELVIKFSMMMEKYVSKVSLEEPKEEKSICSVDVEAIEGPFKTLVNNWKFEYDSDHDQTKITFHLAFEFQSKFLQKLIGAIFEEALKKMLKCFEDRAKELYS
jgi:coenzyme Q-binding protein COQ10